MNELSKAERFKKCLNCGSEENRAKDCKVGKAEPKVTRNDVTPHAQPPQPQPEGLMALNLSVANHPSREVGMTAALRCHSPALGLITCWSGPAG